MGADIIHTQLYPARADITRLINKAKGKKGTYIAR